MNQTDNDYYRNNTVDIDPREVKDTPRGPVSNHQSDGGTDQHADTPITGDNRRQTHASPSVPRIEESMSEGQPEGHNNDNHRDHTNHSNNRDHTNHSNYRDHTTHSNHSNHTNHSYHSDQTVHSNHSASRHLYSERSERSQGQGHGLPKVKEEESFVKVGQLSSPPLSPGQRDLVYQSSINKEGNGEPGRPLTHTKAPRDTSPGGQQVVYLIRSPRKSVPIRSTDSFVSMANSKQSTIEPELKSLSTTPRYSHEDLGRIVSPPSSGSDPPSQNVLANMDDDMKSMLVDADSVKQDLVDQENKRKDSQTRLGDIEEDIKDMHVKMATLRIKLGVANANTNVSKTECEELRKKFQETQIQLARLEERSKSCTTELERLKDPNNPDSNVNMKKVVVNDRKEIRRLRNELEGTRSERSEARKQIEEQDERIDTLKRMLGKVEEQLKDGQSEYEEAKIRCEFEEKEREEAEEKYDGLLQGKEDFEAELSKLNGQLESTVSGTSTIQKLSEQYKTREQDLLAKIASADKKLRDALTEIEQQKNRNMPQRTACSIKYHQYRMSKTSGVVTDTTPQVIVTSDPKGSIAASGYLGKTVVSQKLTTSLPPSRNPGSRPQNRGGKAGSLPSKR